MNHFSRVRWPLPHFRLVQLSINAIIIAQSHSFHTKRDRREQKKGGNKNVEWITGRTKFCFVFGKKGKAMQCERVWHYTNNNIAHYNNWGKLNISRL